MKTLKNYLVITVLAVMQMLVVSSVFAQNSKGAIVLDKKFTPCDDWYNRTTPAPGQPMCTDGTITLEAFVTGYVVTTQIVTHDPCDIVLVLDVSGSMSGSIDNTGTNYVRQDNADYKYNTSNLTTYYYKVGSNYYQIQHEKGQSDKTVYSSTSVSFNNVKSYYYLYEGAYYPLKKIGDNVYFTINNTNYYLVRSDGVWSVTTYISKASNLKNQNIPVYQQSKGLPCYLYYMDGSTKYYLKNGGSTTDINSAAYAINESGTIWNGALYKSQNGGTVSKINTLKDAVETFIDIVAQRAVQDKVNDKISIVKFAKDSYYGNSESSLAEGNHLDKVGYNYYNYTEVVKNLVDVTVPANVTSLKSALNGLSAGGATAADFGMTKAGYVLAQSTSGRNKIVVMFTDGEPNHDRGFNNSVANTTVNKSHAMKGAGALVYTIGVFSNPDSNITNYMNRVSSNSLDATAYNNGTLTNDKYYKLASDAASLTDIFKIITNDVEHGETDQQLGASTVIKDIMSDYFKLPDGIEQDLSSIKVYTANCTGAPGDKYGNTDYKFGTPVSYAAVVEADEESKTVNVTNFSLSDNYCAINNNTDKLPVGKKLIIEIPIEFDNSIGTPWGMDLTQVPTNNENSGVYKDGILKQAFETPYADISNIVLPIDLLTFNAACFDNAIQFTWSTATETNNEYFTIERSEDAENYEAVARIEGAGTSAYQNDYSFMLDNTTNHTMYYRLRQTDIDGTTVVFDPIAVQCEPSEQMIINMFPIPATNNVTLQSNMEMAEVQIHSIYGALVNRMEVNANNTVIDLSSIAAGIYTVKITMANGEQVSRKLIKR